MAGETPEDPGRETATAQIVPTRSGVRIRLPAEGEFDAALSAVDQALAASGGLAGAAVTVDGAGRTLDPGALRQIETLLLERHGAVLLQVVEGSAERSGVKGAAGTRRAGRRRSSRLGGGPPAATDGAAAEEPPVVAPAPAPGPAAPAGDGQAAPPARAPSRAGILSRVRMTATPAAGRATLPVDMTPTLLVRRTLRSGQRVRFNGNVVVLGDVNPGAEIVASGDIVVMGTLRGVAHAGATGSPEAIVAAFRLQPVQLRVGTVIGRAPDGRAPRPDGPEVARLRDGALVVERFLPQGPE